MSTVNMENTVPKREVKDYKSGNDPIWCPGCGDFGVLASLYDALAARNLDPKDVVLVSGIGCSSRLPGFVNTYGFHSVHGRALPIAMGVKLANPELTVIATGGDGDGFAIGGGHIPHICRRNTDITYIVMDNEIYGLTKGQVSPTSPFGLDTNSTPQGSIEKPLNPIAITLVNGATFVARAYSGKRQEMNKIIQKGIEHTGFSFIDAYSPCITFYDTYKIWPQKIVPIPESHDTSDLGAALKLAMDTTVMYTGIFYQKSEPSLEERIHELRKIAQEPGIPTMQDFFGMFK
jgi:2-oxoglutarate/2-oxoacid ferredoxin oxidoreductase subunit beta